MTGWASFFTGLIIFFIVAVGAAFYPDAIARRIKQLEWHSCGKNEPMY